MPTTKFAVGAEQLLHLQGLGFSEQDGPGEGNAAEAASRPVSCVRSKSCVDPSCQSVIPCTGEVHVEVRKGGSKSLQYCVKWKLLPARMEDELASVRSCPDLQKVSCAPGPGFPLRTERGWEKRAGTVNSGGWVLREVIRRDTLIQA